MTMYRGEPPAGHPGGLPGRGSDCQEAAHHIAKAPSAPYLPLHTLANKGPSSQSYGFSSSHVWM